MDLYVNGEHVDASLEDEKTVGDVLRSFEQTCEENDAAVIGICINGEKIDAGRFDTAAAAPLTPSVKIEFEVVTRRAIGDSFAKLSTLFTGLAERMENIPADLQSGHDKEARDSITALADDIDLFCHTAALSSLFPGTYRSVKIDGKPFNEFFADLSDILSQFEQALQNSDTVLVGDLSEYEICPRLRSISSALEAVKNV